MIKTITWKNKPVRFECCDICHIGVGITHYPDGDFEHEERELYKVGKREVCSSCKERIRNEKTNVTRKS